MSTGHGANELPHLLLGLASIFFFSQVLNIFFGRLKLPSVVGDLLTGVMFAIAIVILPDNIWVTSELNYIKSSEFITLLGELGVIILLLEVGLETEINKIVSAGKEATIVALLGVVAPFLCAWGLNIGTGFLLDHNANLPLQVYSIEEVLFIGLVFAATSIGVTARVFQELQMLGNFNAQIILAAAVIDDILGLILLSVIVGLVQSGSFELLGISLIIFKAFIFLFLAIWLNPRLTAKAFPLLGRIGRNEPIVFLIWIVCLCFIFAYLAQFMGLAAIIGAFALGATLDSIAIKNIFGGQQKKVEDYIIPIRAFLVPIFFVKVGISINPEFLFSWLALILTLLACFSKLIAGWVFDLFKTRVNGLLVGVGMMPRGEVGLVVAQLGLQAGVLKGELYSALLVSIIATTIIAPIWLQYLLKDHKEY